MKDCSCTLLAAREQLLTWASQFNVFTLLDSNCQPPAAGHDDVNSFGLLLAAGIDEEMNADGDPWAALQKFVPESYSFGFLTYDLKNSIEKLSSNNFDGIKFPDIHFFHPRYIVKVDKDGCWSVLKADVDGQSLIAEIQRQQYIPQDRLPLHIESRITRDEYLETIAMVKSHILRGDIYEMNFCQEFFATDAVVDPISTYIDLVTISPTPFACFYRLHNRYLISASPERFLKKRGERVVSQPIKGTIRRGRDEAEDLLLKEELRSSRKEQSENVMIVDLVRNDLAKVAADGSVVVSELFGIYPFRQVFQMVSTVEALVANGISPVDVIRECFPMGSMTGAPKVRAMQLIEKYEKSKRGLYSGAVGYFTPAGDFDFNVIIRSILYDSITRYLSFSVGSAITIGSEAAMEYDECLVKAKAIMEVLGEKSAQRKD